MQTQSIATAIRNQAGRCKRRPEGSETRSRAKAVMDPRAPNTLPHSWAGDEIVRPHLERDGSVINRQGGDTSSITLTNTIQLLKNTTNYWDMVGRGLPSLKKANCRVRRTQAMPAERNSSSSSERLGRSPINSGGLIGRPISDNRVNCGKAKGSNPMPIRSEAKGSAESTLERSETRSVSSASNNRIQERPAPHVGDEIVQSWIEKSSIQKSSMISDSLPATLVHPAHGDVIALENQNGILWLLERVETALFTADSSLAFDGESEQWDGLDALIDATSFVDLEGQPPQESDVEEASNAIIEQYGYPTDLFLGTRTLSDLVKTMYPRERVNLPAPVNGQIGQAIESMATQAGVINFQPDVFIRQLPSPPAAATHANAPAAVQTVASATSGTDGDFNKGIPSGTVEFAYAVTACNRFGESSPTIIGANQSLSQANKDGGLHVDITITNAATIGAFPPEFFRVYRSAPLASGAAVPSSVADFSLIAQVAAASQTGSATTAFDDVNFLLPFTSIAYMGELTPQVITFRQLAPLMRLDLAVLAPAYRWMILLNRRGLDGASRQVDRVNCWKPQRVKPVVISRQAAHGSASAVRGADASETRGRAKAVTPPRVPCISTRDEDIVRHPNRKVGSGHKQATEQSLRNTHSVCTAQVGPVDQHRNIGVAQWLTDREGERSPSHFLTNELHCLR